jgi:outer membrane protein OmpA-like peptidoglycan-associated protein
MPVDEIIAALKAPPKLPVGKIYSLDEIEKNYAVRELLQSVEVKSVSFNFNSTDVKGMQAEYLGNIGGAIKKILADRPNEIFFIEGHADAPGTDVYNLALSRKRALQIKHALINVFAIPEKNIMAAGFGEKYLKINTEKREPANRRVTVRCITPLVKATTPTQ